MFFKKSIGALVLASVLSVAIAPAAHAFVMGDIVVNLATDAVGTNDGQYELDFGGNNAIMFCVLLLPFCILDQKSEYTPAITRQDLLNNLYSEAEADQIINDSHNLASTLHAKNEKLVVSPEDTAASISQDIRNVMPAASDVFVSYYSSLAIARK